MRRMLTIAALTLAAGYAALCALVFVAQRSMLFPAPTAARTPRLGTTVTVPSGTPLFYVAPREPTAPVVVHFHGNGEALADTEWLAQLYGDAGLGFAAIEYPGYGLAANAGSPSEASIVDAAEKGVAHLVSALGVSKDRLVLSGQSIGTGPAVALARKGWGTRLLLVSAYTSLPDVGARVFPFLPVRLLMRDRFDSASHAPHIAIPVLAIHGTDDEVIPFDLGKTLAARFPSARFLAIERAHHNDIWEKPEVQAAAVSFARGP